MNPVVCYENNNLNFLFKHLLDSFLYSKSIENHQITKLIRLQIFLAFKEHSMKNLRWSCGVDEDRRRKLRFSTWQVHRHPERALDYCGARHSSCQQLLRRFPTKRFHRLAEHRCWPVVWRAPARNKKYFVVLKIKVTLNWRDAIKWKLVWLKTRIFALVFQSFGRVRQRGNPFAPSSDYVKQVARALQHRPHTEFYYHQSKQHKVTTIPGAS